MEKLYSLGRRIIPKWLFRLGQPVYHFLLALSGNIIYRFPARKMICVGITGTNGKSTTVELVNSVLKAAGEKTGMISTVAIEVAGKRRDNKTSRTTLGRWQTPRLLRQMVKAGCRYVVIEVASEGIVQFRTWGIPFDVAVFTNLSPEHLNTHKTMTNYRNAKGKLFENLTTGRRKKLNGKPVPKVSIINADDKESKYFGAFPADNRLSYGLKKGQVTAQKIKQNGKLSFEIFQDGKTNYIQTDLIGQFNIYNILAAWCVGIALELEPRKIKWGLEEIKSVKGRMEKVAEKSGVKYFIDYAMTPDSYELLLTEMRRIAKGQVILVFGAAGDRDRSKRPTIGEIAAREADYSIITDDEPYSEDPKAIIAEIEAGFKKVGASNYEVISDRKRAIAQAAKIAKAGDVVVVPGIGHQSYRNLGGTKKVAWNEAEIIRKIVG